MNVPFVALALTNVTSDGNVSVTTVFSARFGPKFFDRDGVREGAPLLHRCLIFPDAHEQIGFCRIHIHIRRTGKVRLLIRAHHSRVSTDPIPMEPPKKSPVAASLAVSFCCWLQTLLFRTNT